MNSRPRRRSLALAAAAIAIVLAIVVGPRLLPSGTSPAGSSVPSTAAIASASPSFIRASSGPSAPLVTAGPIVGRPELIRVNQVGYEAGFGAGKRAYLMADIAAGASTFELIAADGGVAFSAPVPARSLGSWNQAYGFVYPLDFPTVTAPGTYSLAVSGIVGGRSPSFRIDSSANLVDPLLADARLFYEGQRDGPNVIGSVLNRQPAHLNDEVATAYAPPTYDADGALVGDLHKVGGPLDVSGGWADAGDYVKFVETTSYTVDVMLVARRDHPARVGAGSSADISGEARFGLDWLLKMWDDLTATLYYQVAIGDGNDAIQGDHDQWRLPQVDDTIGGTAPDSRYLRHRPAFRAGPAGALVSPNLAGRLAAAFALCYQVEAATDRVEAERCLRAGEHIFDLANTKPGKLLTASPFDYYPETQWRDDLELGATELAQAVAAANASGEPIVAGLPHVDPAFYLASAAHWAKAYLAGPKDFDTLNLYDVAGLAHFELARAIDAGIGGPGATSGLEVSRSQLVADIGARLDEAVARGARDPFEFGGDFTNFDSTSHAFGLVTQASEYDELTGTDRYAAFGRRQLGVVLGANAWGTSLVVGAGTTFPHCMQHQVANLAGSLDGTAPILAGAVVNGPNGPIPDFDLSTPGGARACSEPLFGSFNGHGSVFFDNVASWPTVEPSLDYSVGQILALARVGDDLR